MQLLISKRPVRLCLLALSLTWAALFLFPTAVQAHAILLRSTPAKDAVLTTAPTQVQMWFSEDLNPTFSSAVVVNRANQRIDKNDARVSTSDPREIDLSLPSDLPSAVYVVVWRTQSASDGHVLRGSFRFSIEGADGSIPSLNGAQPGLDELGGTVDNANSGQLDNQTFFSFLMITLVELGTVFWVGAQLWQSFVSPSTEDTANEEQSALERQAQQRFARRFAIPALVLTLLTNLGVLIGQGLQLTGGNLGQALAPSLLWNLISSGHFGLYWSMREIVLLVALGIALYRFRLRAPGPRVVALLSWLNLLLGLALLIAVTFSSHAAAVSNNVVYAVLGDWLHLLAAALWVGGMLYLARIYLPAWKNSHASPQLLLTTLQRFSPLAISGVVLMALSGPLNATFHMSSFEQLINTAYGRALSVKIVLVVAMLVTSAIHVFLWRPALSKAIAEYNGLREGDASVEATDPQENAVRPLETPESKLLEQQITQKTHRLTRMLIWEPVLGVAVLICVGLMSVFAGTLQPATTTTVPKATAFATNAITTDKAFSIKLTVSPNHFGTNVFTVSVFDSNGKPDTNVGVSIYTIMLDMDMGTDTINLQPDGKGYFSAPGDLNMGGNWELRVQIRTPENTLHEVQVHMVTPL
ncbi:copper resistance protein CopC [Tengunoibacter tsumagoiensis]|uniref:Copper resistance protein CopC n=1 Tax=Tengunoibacter tsumagoiensis TaxID=2014871 RepID=A0A401ZX46_9CHLR|nr:copper resistance protein CopC [Tengunoibacter tsumagoiensis]GCE11374.1 hypothetical protein KTT_12330 [Tengunoibacter tsumagoiensis]